MAMPLQLKEGAMCSAYAQRLSNLILMGLVLLFATACSRELNECSGASLNTDELNALKETLSPSGPRAFLIVPNPIEVTQTASVKATDASLESIMDPFQLPGLLSPSRLENAFLKIRIKTIKDDLTTLATPNSKDGYDYPVSDVHYSEVMAYYAISNMKRYVEALGFPVLQTRPLYVMVRGNDENTPKDQVNAYYLHNRNDTTLPREMILYGDTAYTPGVDRDVFWHEFGHLFNESVSGEVGIDLSGERGAMFSEGAALHECLADYLAESVSNRGGVGKWIARNFNNIQPGDPLRSAVRVEDDKNQFSDVSTFDSSLKVFDRYRMAEWCSRVLWDVRSQFVSESPEKGAFLSDRLIFSSLAFLKKDASIKEFREALSTADSEMYCGLHSKSIKNAFESRGFNESVGALGTPLQLSTQVSVLTQGEDQKVVKATTLAGSNAFFAVKISNPNSVTARNVRVILEALDNQLIPVSYLQSYGDLPAGNSILTATQNGLDPVYYAVNASIPKGVTAGKIKYRLRVLVENGPETTVNGEFGL